MHQHLKQHPERAFLHFIRVYCYITNTKKPWDKLTNAQREHKDFKWTVRKWFFAANAPIITVEDIKHHETICPELDRTPGVNDKCEDPTDDWKCRSEFYEIYPPFPLTEYDTQLLINTLGLRMFHMMNVHSKESGNGMV